ncbi:MAG: DUF2723 domain-containing protein, partial [Chloroflexi bacterium]|nr:DUF2723 domain-containing protein [Chloroflexota bacterium]
MSLGPALGAVAVFATVLGVYLALLPADPMLGDPSSFTVAAYRLGQPHFPYPLHTLLGSVFTKLPWSTVAWRVGLLSAVAGAGSASVVYLLVCRMLPKLYPRSHAIIAVHSSAGVAALSFAFSSGLWRASEIPEVYSLNALFTVAVLVLMLRWDDTGSRRSLYLAALFYGLSLGLQYLNLAFLPALVLFAMISARRSDLRGVKPLAFVGAFVVLGLLQFIYLPLRPLGPPPDVSTLGDYWDFALGPWFDIVMGSVGEMEWRVVRRVAGALLVEEFSIIGVLLAAVGVWAWGSRRPRHLVLLLGLFVLSRLALAPVVGLPSVDSSLGFFIVPSSIVVTLFIGVGVFAVQDALRRVRIVPGALRPAVASDAALRWVVAALLIVGSAAYVFGRYSDHKPAQVAAKALAEDTASYSRALLEHLPAGSTLLTDWTFGTPLWYYQFVEGLGRGVEVRSVWPEELPAHAADPNARGDIYVTHHPEEVIRTLSAARFLQYKWMKAYRVVSPEDYLAGAPPAISHPAEVNLANEIVFLGYNLKPTSLRPGESFQVEYFWKALARMRNNYEVFVHFVGSDGRTAFQQDHLPVGGVYSTSEW